MNVGIYLMIAMGVFGFWILFQARRDIKKYGLGRK